MELLKRKGALTTSEIEREVSRGTGDCPDGSVKTLMKLRRKGLIEGKMVPSKGGWVWDIAETE
ncbi:MAG: hypothetical protein U9R03_02270 [Candidatus Aerophobetes bacterium]|nr:hypothetical protein [Candidatus Aerophobetes bacterium]